MQYLMILMMYAAVNAMSTTLTVRQMSGLGVTCVTPGGTIGVQD